MKKGLIRTVLSFLEDLAGDWNKKHSSKVTSNESGHTRKTSSKDIFPKEDSRQQSLSSSQGQSDFSGSSYNGPGNVDREKRNSNMSQRNF
jgi:hypothetical protein